MWRRRSPKNYTIHIVSLSALWVFVDRNEALSLYVDNRIIHIFNYKIFRKYFRLL